MAESQTMVFETEEARQQAMDALPDTPENESQLDAILNAEIKPKEEAANSPASPEEVVEPIEEKTESVESPEPAPTADEFFQIKKSELPEGYDSPGKAFKSLLETKQTVERQTKFIKEKLGGGDENLQAAIQRAEKAEKELAETRKANEKPAQQETKDENLTAIPESNAAKIKAVRLSLKELAKDPEMNESEILAKRSELEDLLIDENDRNALLIERATKRAEEAEARAIKAESTTTGFLDETKRERDRRKAEENLSKDFTDMDTFSNDADYPEFKLSKSVSDIDKEYSGWASEVTRLYYGVPVNIFSEQGKKLMVNAMTMLERGAPEIVEKCQMAGVMTKPNEDIQKYLDICDLMDYRDGQRVNPSTGQKEMVYRYNSAVGKEVPDGFPTLKAAYENRKIMDGVYAKRIRDAYIDGGKSMAEAAARVDTGAAEMGNTGGVSRRDAGLEMNQEEAQKVIDTIDGVSAKIKAMNGDKTDFERLNKAFKIVGIPEEVL